MPVVYSYYVLDIIHQGHILFMQNARAIAGENGTHLVGILTDEAVMERKDRPVLSFQERMEIAKAIKYADVVVPQETYSPIANITRIAPDILIESTSHDLSAIREARVAMETIGGRVIVLPYYPHQSSSAIKAKVRNSKD